MKPPESIIMPYQEILYALPLPVIVLNHSNEELVFVNKPAAALFKKLTNTKRGVTYSDIKIILPDINNAEGSGSVTNSEYKLNYGKKASIWLEVITQTVAPGKEEYSIIIITDITDRKTKALQMIQSLEKERSLLEMKTNFISMASHEFKTPLTAISSTMELLETKMQMDNLLDQFYRHNISKISSEIFKLNTMLDEILTLSTIAANNIEVRKQAVEVERVIADIKYQYFSERKDDRVLNLKVSGTPRTIYADKNQLSKIFTNLVGNAFKYSSSDPLVKVHYQKTRLVIKVTDNGVGIPQKDMPYLYNSFFRGSNVDSIEGTGLGLSIVKDFVERNNGSIFVESEENRGTTFTIIFKYPDEAPASQ
jgi:signal transduction histidine kinase